MILEMIWGLWSELPAHGRKAAQFVDLLGYFSLKHSEPRPADEEGPNDDGRRYAIRYPNRNLSSNIHDTICKLVF